MAISQESWMQNPCSETMCHWLPNLEGNLMAGRLFSWSVVGLPIRILLATMWKGCWFDPEGLFLYCVEYSVLSYGHLYNKLLPCIYYFHASQNHLQVSVVFSNSPWVLRFLRESSWPDFAPRDGLLRIVENDYGRPQFVKLWSCLQSWLSKLLLLVS